MRFVTDTGPLLHLHETGAWALLPMLGTIETTPVVAAELNRHLPLHSSVEWPLWLRVARPSAAAKTTAQLWTQAGLLDQGEAEALAVARDTNADGFLTDDAEARALASTLKVEARGSLGVVLMAAAHGHIKRDEAAEFLRRLENHSTLWLSKRVRRAAHDALRQIYHT